MWEKWLYQSRSFLCSTRIFLSYDKTFGTVVRLWGLNPEGEHQGFTEFHNSGGEVPSALHSHPYSHEITLSFKDCSLHNESPALFHQPVTDSGTRAESLDQRVTKVFQIKRPNFGLCFLSHHPPHLLQNPLAKILITVYIHPLCFVLTRNVVRRMRQSL